MHYAVDVPERTFLPPDSVQTILPRAQVALPSGDISYVDVGRGTPIVLLHGAPMTSIGFIRVIQALRPNYRVIVPDFPGFGYSRAAVNFGSSLCEYGQFIAEFLETLKLSDAVLFLNDSSTCMGFHAAPKIGGRLRALVVADTVALPMTGQLRIVSFALRSIIGSKVMYYLNRNLNLIPWMVATLAPMWHPFSKQIRRMMTSQFDSAEKRDRLLHVFRQMGSDAGFMNQAAERAQQYFSHLPVLLLYGQFDPMRLLGSIERLRKLFTNTRTVIVAAEEHFPILGSGAKVGDAIDRFVSGIK